MQKFPLKKLFADLIDKDNFVFLESKVITSQDHRSYLFTNPVEIIACKKLDQIESALKRIEKLLGKGYFAAGFISYEAGYAFEEILKAKRDYDFPLLWFGIYEKPVIFDHHKMRFTDETQSSDYTLNDLSLNVSEKEYINTIERIKSLIECGDTYQVNYTFRLNFSFSGSISDLYRNLRRNQSVSYSAFIRFGKKHIVSFSPELFFRKDGEFMQVKPMKGTAKRGGCLEEDRKKAIQLHLCPKNRSENVMIVDLLRNDLGRISDINTVKTKRLFEVENYESLLQMTSTIESRLRSGLSLYELFKAVFPSGSVTGAPKIRTMQIIDELEKEPRRIYTGSIGFISPEKKSVFNVAIRTLLIDNHLGKGEMGIGSGVVYDSNPKREYAECKLKAKFLTEQLPDFKLIETMLWEPGKGYAFLNLHLERLSQSAAYFKFSYDGNYVIKKLQRTGFLFDKEARYKVRLLLNRDGEITITSSVTKIDESEKLLAISETRTLASDIFLFHKTTNRELYSEEYKRYKDKGYFDIIFQNERGEITEAAASNIFIRKDKRYYTPPVECGLLNGVYRRYLIRNKIIPVEEKILYPQDLKEADEIILTNAVRGMMKAKLKKTEVAASLCNRVGIANGEIA